jgi:HNH endonuclease
MLTCNHCQCSFIPNRSNKKNPQKYCSAECSANARRTKQYHPCAVCSTSTLNPKFCSNSCAATYNNTAVPKRTKNYKICPTCGNLHSRTKFCSDECNPHRLKLSEDEKYRYVRAKKNEAWQRYMAKRKNQTPEDADIKALQEFYLNCPIGYEVDHKIPISKGGLHSIENLQYLTISENRKKSNKLI